MDIEPNKLLTAIADQTRLRIVNLLNQGGELCVCDLVVALDTHQPKISRHLAVLRERGVLTVRRQGTWVHYRLNPELPTWVTHALMHLADGCTTRAPYTADLERLAALKPDSHRCE